MSTIHFSGCSMCLDISPDRLYVREGYFPRGNIFEGRFEPSLGIVPLTPPDDGSTGVGVPISSDDPLFQKWFGIIKRKLEEP